MLFPEEEAPLLKAWIVKRLENTSDADADVLADYVLALLRHEGDLASIRKLCEQETHDFLQEDSVGFVDDVFKAITFKTYLSKAPQAPPPDPFDSTTAVPGQEFQKQLNPNLPSFVPGGNFNAPDAPNGPSSSRKRTYHDRGEIDNTHGPEASLDGGRGGKFPKRGGRNGRQTFGDNGLYAAGPSAVPRSQYPGPDMAPRPIVVPPLDPNDPFGSIMRQWQALGLPVPPMPDMGAPGANRQFGRQRGSRRKRCRDFDTKGICARGQACPFDHGSEPVFYPPSAEVNMSSEEYDPNNALLDGSQPHDQMLLPHFPSFPDMSRRSPATGHRGGRSGSGAKSRGTSRSPFSADGPTHDRSNTSIVVENIPEESFGEEQVREFFGQFGEITEVSMQPYKHLAIVKYTNWGSANAAYRSPKVIFENRFVKVFWFKQKEGEDSLPASMSLNGGKARAAKEEHGGNGDVPQDDDMEIDMDEFMRKQEEAQKAYEERAHKVAELERQREELEKRQHELVAKQLEESRRLREKLAQNDGKDGPDAPKTGVGGASSTERLRAQLAALEEEAKILGIDPDAMDETPPSWAGNPRGGYSYGSRGRGVYGIRGGYSPRGYRAGYRGRADVRAAYAAYSLDNRPKVIAVSGADFTDAGKDETLRHFLLNIGEFKDIRPSASITYITFTDRKTAEKFMAFGKQIPGLSDQLELSWSIEGEAEETVSEAPKSDIKPAPTPGEGLKRAAANTVTEEDVNGDDGHEAGEQNMDYDVADENDWGVS